MGGNAPPPPVINRQNYRHSGKATDSWRPDRGPLHTTHGGALHTARSAKWTDSGSAKAWKASALDNLSRGLSAETVAHDWVKSAYGGRAKLRGAILRNNGVPVLDLVFDVGDGEFVVVESKAANSQLSRTVGRMAEIGPDGTTRILTISGEFEQFSPEWFDDRLDEMADSSHNRVQRLGKELDASRRAGKARFLVIRAPEGHLNTERALEVLDYSEEHCAHVGTKPNHRIPRGTAIGQAHAGATVGKGVSAKLLPEVRQLRLHSAQAKALDSAIGNLQSRLDKARKAARTLNNKIMTLKLEDAYAHRPGSKVQAKEKLRIETELAAAKRDVVAADTHVRDTDNKLFQAQERRKALKEQIKADRAEVQRLYKERSSGTLASRSTTEAARAAQAATAHDAGTARQGAHADEAAPKETAKTKASDTAPDKRRAAEAAAPSPHAGAPHQLPATVTHAGTPASRLALMPHPTGIVRAAATVAPKAAGRMARVLSVSRKVGTAIIHLTVPLSVLDVALEFALWLYDWDRKRRGEEEAEWKRIYAFLFNHAAPVPDKVLGTYSPSAAKRFYDAASAKLESERDSENMAHWVVKWDTDRNFRGFVYARARAELLRQKHRRFTAQSLEVPNPIRYWVVSLAVVLKSYSVTANRDKNERETAYLDPEDPKNRFTDGKSGNPENRKAPPGQTAWESMQAQSQYRNSYVESRTVMVYATAPTPVATPFDIAIFKCRDLMIEILRYLWRFDDRLWAMAPFEETEFFTHFWFEDVVYPDCFHKPGVDYCLKQLKWLIDVLSLHNTTKDDTAETGWERRRRILVGLIPPNRSRDHLTILINNLRHFPQEELAATYMPEQNDELTYITRDYLIDLAEGIRATLNRMYKDIMQTGSAVSHEYRYLGTKDTK